jgi:hypothetical protein
MPPFKPSHRNLLGGLLAGLSGWLSSATAKIPTPPQSSASSNLRALAPFPASDLVTVVCDVSDGTYSSAQSFTWTVPNPVA